MGTLNFEKHRERFKLPQVSKKNDKENYLSNDCVEKIAKLAIKSISNFN